jgi:acetyl-CoA synthetase|tara:strand:+ start:1034 stop:1186 length:153 start_codon:yes stop_codon:yes gene_type:complete
MSSNLYPVSESSQANSHANKAEYQRLYQWSVEDPEGFWSEQGQRIDWIKP